MTFITAAIIGGGFALAGGAIAANASRTASNTQRDSANAAIQAQKEADAKQQALNAPFRDNGLAGQNRLMYLLGLSPNPNQSSQLTKDQIRAQLLPQFTSSGNDDVRNAMLEQAGGNQNRLIRASMGGPVDENGLNAAIDKQFNAQGPAGAVDPAYGSLARNFGSSDFQTDPGYQFRLAQGQQAIERSQAARGGLLSGGAIKAASDYNQGMASNEYNNAYNRFQTNRANILNPLQSLSGAGQTASNVLGQNALQSGVNQGNYLTQAGNAQASGYVGPATAINNALSQGINSYQNYNAMNNINSGSGYNYNQGASNAGAVEGTSNFRGPSYD